MTPDRRRRGRGRTPGGVRDPQAAEDPGVTEAAEAAGVTGEAGTGTAGATGTAGVSDDPHERARQVCLRLLTLAPRTSAQLADAMRRKGVPAEAAEAVLSRLAEVGLIDDAAFARAWVESRHHARGLSRRALTLELERRGVPGDDVQAAVGALDPGAEVATAQRLVAKAMPGTRGRPPQARVRRLVGLLARRGYPAPLAYRVVREALEQEGIDAEDVGLDLDGIDETSSAGQDAYE